ncbi:MAG: hypothetical protein E6Q97_36665 [Desulfurellales bacterium]|nr:MAG: hypothetical protein E6Q97_36665 [Desulfurellales bacterium]
MARFAFAAEAAQQFSEADGWDVVAMQLREGRVPAAGDVANLMEAMGGGMGRDLLSMGIVYPEMITIVQEAKLPGESVKINRPRFINGATTASSRLLSGSARVFGTNSQPLVTDQVDVTVREYGGPGDSTGAVVPISVGSFAANRAMHNLFAQTGLELKRDRHKFVDDLLYSLAIAAVPTANVVRGGSATTDAAFTGSGNEPMTYDLLVRASEPIKQSGVAGVGGKAQYLCLVDVHQLSQLKLDSRYQRLGVFQPEYNALFPGYAKTVDDLIICGINTTAMRVSNLGAGGTTAGYNALIMAPACLGWGSGMSAKVIRDRNDDGGRHNAFAWIAYEGWTVLESRGFAKITTT